MSNPDSDELLEAYRKASAEDAGAPGESVRRAILAEAASAARRRTPAANDSRFYWRAVAGVAVLGVALLLWRQVAPPPIEPRVTARIAEQAAPEARTSPAPAPAQQPAASARDISDSARAARRETSPAQLLQRFFPGPYASRTPPQSLWLVLDEAGNALARGQLGPGEELSAATQSAQPALGNRRLDPWMSLPVTNLHGLHIEFSVARAH